jgi:glyoxylase-like metal-dependent hydrolase (beta-lactamase superfamily II)
MEVIQGVYQIRAWDCNLYLIVEDGELTLIDGGTRKAFKRVLEFLKHLELPYANLKRILLTHADIDHVGAVNLLKELTGAQVCASRVAAEALSKGRSSRPLQVWGLRRLSNKIQPRLHKAMHIQVDWILEPGERLPLLGGLEVLAAPGHTPGQVVFYSQEKRLLFSGDAFNTRSGLVDYNLSRTITWDADLVVETHKKLAALQPEIVCGGHGPVVYNAVNKFLI